MKVLHFNPRRAGRAGGTVNAGGTGNLSTAGIYNNGQGSEYIAIRYFNIGGSANDVIAVGSAAGTLGLTAGVAQPIMANETQPNGLPYAGYTTSVIIAGVEFYPPASQTQFYTGLIPIAVLPAGYGFYLQVLTANVALVWGMIWEVLKPEEIDAGRLLEANLAILAQNNSQ